MTDLGSASIDALIVLYSDAARALRRLNEQGKSRGRAGRRAQLIPHLVYSELRRRGEPDALLPLLHAEDIGVRSMAAVHALDFAPSLGEPVLQRMQDAPADEISTIGRLAAWRALREWRAGRLNFPDLKQSDETSDD